MATGPAVVRFVGVIRELLDHDHDHWCRVCLLATGVRAFIVIRRSDGDSMRLEQQTWCTECGSRDIEVSPDGRHC